MTERPTGVWWLGSIQDPPIEQRISIDGGFKHFVFSPRTLGFHDPIRLAHIFQMGWFNHQLGMIVYLWMFPFPRCKRGISWWKHFWCVNGQEFLPPKQLTKILRIKLSIQNMNKWNLCQRGLNVYQLGLLLDASNEVCVQNHVKSIQPKSRWKRNGNNDSAICNAFNTCAVNAVSSLTAPSPHQHQFGASDYADLVDVFAAGGWSLISGSFRQKRPGFDKEDLISLDFSAQDINILHSRPAFFPVKKMSAIFQAINHPVILGERLGSPGMIGIFLLNEELKKNPRILKITAQLAIFPNQVVMNPFWF